MYNLFVSSGMGQRNKDASPPEEIEPMAFRLPVACSTTELQGTGGELQSWPKVLGTLHIQTR